MPGQLQRILQVSILDTHGGAEKVAWNLFKSYRARGYDSWLAVGFKRSDDPDVLRIRNRRADGVWSRLRWNIYSRLQSRAGKSGNSWRYARLAKPGALLDLVRGAEDFRSPGTWGLLDLPPERPDIIHCHNLHGGYFDLKVLPWLSRQVPVVLTLHDAWLLSGHCVHSFDCDRWKTGCGRCPYLRIPVTMLRDETARNWQTKRDIFAKSRLYVATPSRWLMERVEQSMLAPGVVEARVIPNGVDLDIFRPGDKQAARAALGIPQDAKVLLFAANGIRKNVSKDYQTMRTAVSMIANRLRGQDLLFLALGEGAPGERLGSARIRFIPHEQDANVVASYYQAADVYVHAARAESWGLVISEAMACGTTVVATAVGGIPEQVKGLRDKELEFGGYEAASATGVLTPPGDPSLLAEGTARLLKDPNLCLRLGSNANKVAQGYSQQRQADAYLGLYQSAQDRSSVSGRC